MTLPRAPRARLPQWEVLVLLVALVAFSPPTALRAGPPINEELLERADKGLVILVPGVTGSKLRRTDTGELIWGTARLLISPKDGGYAAARPLSLDLDADSGVEAFEVIEQMRLFGVIRRDIYGPVRETLEANGYVLGDLTRPSTNADFFMFAYDWREDLVRSAIELGRQLEGLRRARGSAALEVDLICQSAGGQVCRYLAKFGAVPLDAAERSDARSSEGVRVRKIILVGTANGGGIRILRELHRGRTYVPGIGRKMQPEVLFSYPALFQDLPRNRSDLFVDEQGAHLALDLFDADTWVRHGLSIFAADVTARLERASRDDLFSNHEGRVRALGRFLNRARRLHEVLRRDAEGFSSRYYSIQNTRKATPARVVLERTDEGWDLHFTGDKELAEGSALYRRATSLGDGHADVASQNWLSPQEQDALATPKVSVNGDHFGMINETAALEAILSFLAEE